MAEKKTLKEVSPRKKWPSTALVRHWNGYYLFVSIKYSLTYYNLTHVFVLLVMQPWAWLCALNAYVLQLVIYLTNMPAQWCHTLYWLSTDSAWTVCIISYQNNHCLGQCIFFIKPLCGVIYCGNDKTHNYTQNKIIKMIQRLQQGVLTFPE